MSNSKLVTKRLHISGLTPQISAADLKSRFSSFGNVKALDGLGRLDALGQPRPFAYVTLEATKPQLARCLNLLSGTTWKGAKLRIGEAKPDFRERILKENEAAVNGSIRPLKRRRVARGTQGIHAQDMSLVTPMTLRPSWRITPLGRLVRPMRMRPLRPLLTLPSAGAQKLKERIKKTRKKTRSILVRARRRKIDPEEWGSTYMSGLMLENGTGVILLERSAKSKEASSLVASTVGIDADVDEASSQSDSVPKSQPMQEHSLPLSSLSPLASARPALHAVTDTEESRCRASGLGTGLAKEATRSLALLNSLFGSGDAGRSNDEEDWGGAESLSDLDIDAAPRIVTAGVPGAAVEDDGIEYVARQVPAKSMVTSPKRKELETSAPEVMAMDDLVPTQEQQTKDVAEVQPQDSKVQMTKLKNMFAPRPEDTGFSILGNLELDLELDEDLPSMSAPPPPPPQPTESDTYPSTASVGLTTSHHSTFTFDPKRPFFFPHSLFPHSPLDIKPGDPRDIFSGKIDFFRTETEEEIRKKWEERKVELTRDWKRRHREAVKSARRRGGVQD